MSAPTDNPPAFGRIQVLPVMMPADRLHLFQNAYIFEKEHGHTLFSQPVPQFSLSKNIPIICLIKPSPKRFSYIAIGNRGYPGGTGLTQIEIRDFIQLESPLQITALVREVEKRHKEQVESCLTDEALITPAASRSLLKAIYQLAPEARAIINQAVREDHKSTLKATTGKERTLVEHRDAVLSAFMISGLVRKETIAVTEAEDEGEGWFLDRIGPARFREDPMVINDAGCFPGLSKTKANIHGKRFTDGRTNLTIMLANRLPLEELTGSDLVYYNETFKSFIFVQYKAFEKEGGKSIFRLPSEQLAKEISRMDEIDAALSKKSERKKDPNAYRINLSPFFLKFCSREVADSGSLTLYPGMYFPLEYWKQLEASKLLQGPRRGKALKHENVQRFMNNSDFCHLVQNSWVGTSPAQSKLLKKVVEKTLQTGRAVTLAHVAEKTQ